MILTITTKSGTVYTIDTEKRTWKRERHPEDCEDGFVSNSLELNEGDYASLSFGDRLVIVTTPKTSIAGKPIFDSYFYVRSTPIVSVSGEA